MSSFFNLNGISFLPDSWCGVNMAENLENLSKNQRKQRWATLIMDKFQLNKKEAEPYLNHFLRMHTRKFGGLWWKASVTKTDLLVIEIVRKLIDREVHLTNLVIDKMKVSKEKARLILEQRTCIWKPNVFELSDENVMNHIEEKEKAKIKDIGRLTCKLCCKIFASKQSMKRHMLKYHGPQTEEVKAHKNNRIVYQRKCPSCEKTFKYMSSLEEHIRKAHKSHPLAEYNCEQCEKKFSFERSLKLHMKTHSKKVLECCICKNVFTRSDNLDRHKLKKHGITNLNLDYMKNSYNDGYRCPMCGANFAEDIEELQHHLIQKICQDINKERIIDECGNYKCEHCDKAFTNFSNLNEHIRWKHNTAIQSSRCPHCEKTFKWQKSLKVHIKKNHEDKDD